MKNEVKRVDRLCLIISDQISKFLSFFFFGQSLFQSQRLIFTFYANILDALLRDTIGALIRQVTGGSEHCDLARSRYIHCCRSNKKSFLFDKKNSSLNICL